MTGLRQAILTGALVAASALAGCASQHYGYASIGPPPPPLVAGAVGYAPGPGYAWAEGFWDLRGGRWFWVGGQWARRPHPRAVWVQGYWSPYGRSHRWHRGYWR